MDAPALGQMRRWYAVSMVIWATVALLCGLGQSLARWRHRRRNLPDSQAASGSFRPLHWLTLAACGAAGTTLLSLWARQFIFTWPLGLFAALGMAVYESGAERTPAANCRGYAVLGLFIGVCLGYFLLCRRLSLAFEWVFLAAFPAALPALLLSRRATHGPRWATAGGLLWEGVALSAYYWTAVGFMLWKYPT